MENRHPLKELKKDRRDFQLGAIIKLPELSELPDEFVLEGSFIENQSANPLGEDLCSAFASTVISEFQEGVELSPEWSFAASKELSGDVEGFGQNMRDAMKVHQKYGAVEKSEITIPNNPRYFANWDKSLLEKAKKHFKQSYVSITGQYEIFDNIKASIYYYRNEKRAVSFGLIWGYNLSDVLLKEIKQEGYGHMVAIIGWKKIEGETYLIVQNSYGKEAGENGKHYISRKVINYFAKRYGAMMFIDENPETIKKLQWSYIQILIDYIAILQKMISDLLKKNKPVLDIEDAIIEEAVKTPTSRIAEWAEAIKDFE